MTDKEIIIDGKKENFKILFECGSINDLASYDMIRKDIDITPENAPVKDMDIKLVANRTSLYGFSCLFKRNKSVNEWEYMGLGHSGACSIITALLKQLQRKEQECEQLHKANDEKNEFLQTLGISATGEFHRIKHYIDKLKQECEELKQWQVDAENILKEQLDNFDKTENRYKQALEEIKGIWGKDEDGDYDFIKFQTLNVINEVLKDE